MMLTFILKFCFILLLRALTIIDAEVLWLHLLEQGMEDHATESHLS